LKIEQGFVLTRHARDVAGQTQIELWLATPSGPTQLIIRGERPVFFIEQSACSETESVATQLALKPSFSPLPLRSFQDQALTACYTNTIRDSQTLAEKLAHADILTFEADIRLADRFLMERFIQGSIEFTGQITDFGQ